MPVAGVGEVDRAQIAQQMAAALIAQGKTNVSSEELAQLVDAVVRCFINSVCCNSIISRATVWQAGSRWPSILNPMLKSRQSDVRGQG